MHSNLFSNFALLIYGSLVKLKYFNRSFSKGFTFKIQVIDISTVIFHLLYGHFFILLFIDRKHTAFFTVIFFYLPFSTVTHPHFLRSFLLKS